MRPLRQRRTWWPACPQPETEQVRRAATLVFAAPSDAPLDLAVQPRVDGRVRHGHEIAHVDPVERSVGLAVVRVGDVAREHQLDGEHVAAQAAPGVDERAQRRGGDGDGFDLEDGNTAASARRRAATLSRGVPTT